MIPASELTRSLRETTQALKLGSGAVGKISMLSMKLSA
jgi:hypothetical protein